MNTNAVESPSEPLQGIKLIMLCIAAATATFMEILDITISNVAIPAISGSLGIAISQGTWIISAYSVAAAIAVPITGWAAKRYGEVRLFVISVIAFTIASALAAFATNLCMIGTFRFIQGFVSGPMVPLSQTLIIRAFPPEKKGVAMSIWAMTVILAPICGPLLGGYISDNWHWSWIFLINIPPGLMCAITVYLLMSKRDSPTQNVPLDYMGLILLIVGIGSLQLMLELGRDADWFSSTYIVVLAITAVVGLTFFIGWALTHPTPIVDLRLFKDRNFCYGSIILSVGFMIYFGIVVILPLWLQTIMHYTATDTGLVIAPVGIGMIIFAPIVGKNINRLNLQIILSLGFFIMGAVSMWNGFMALHIDYAHIVYPRLLQGVGMACFFIPVQSLMLSNISTDKTASAAGLSNFLRALATAFSSASSVTLWENMTQYNRANLVEHFNGFTPTAQNYIDALKLRGIEGQQALAVIERTIHEESAMVSTNTFFFYCGGAFFALIFLVWLTKRIKTTQQAQSDEHGIGEAA